MSASAYLFACGTLVTGTWDPEINALARARLEDAGAGHVRGRLYRLGGFPGPLRACAYYYNRPVGRAPRIESGDYAGCLRDRILSLHAPASGGGTSDRGRGNRE